ncbi:MAG: hypothetical protein ACUZ8H_16690 [Candidatus Anammoxibacter sp.]
MAALFRKMLLSNKQIFNFNDDYNLINPYCFKTPKVPGIAASEERALVSFDIIKKNIISCPNNMI